MADCLNKLQKCTIDGQVGDRVCDRLNGLLAKD